MGASMIARLAGFAAFAALAWLAIALSLAPIGGEIGALPGPDLLFCVVAVVSARRPALAPPVLVFAIGLIRDLLGGGAIGIGALALTVASAALAAQAEALRRRGFLAEWGLAAAWAACALALQWALLTVTLAPAPPLASLGGGLLATALTYPLCALLLRKAPRRGGRAEGRASQGRASQGRAWQGWA